MLPPLADVHGPVGRPGLALLRRFRRQTILGDLNTQSIAEIWNAEPYRAVRREHLESGGPDVCRACDLPRKDSPLWITEAGLSPNRRERGCA